MRHPAAPRPFGARLPPPDRRASRLCAGSGSTYIYGFCDAYYRPGMNQQQCEEFVTKGTPPLPQGSTRPPAHAARAYAPQPPGSVMAGTVSHPPRRPCPAALCHAMARDGSSGGVIRTVRIDESGVERKMLPGNKLPYGPL